MTIYDYALQKWLTGREGAIEAARQAQEIISLDWQTLSNIARSEGVHPSDLHLSNARKLAIAKAELDSTATL